MQDIPAEVGDRGPAEIRAQQLVLAVDYVDFDGQQRQGKIVIHRELARDVEDWFKLALKLRFPIHQVALAVEFGYDDNCLMAGNVTSGFNYRQIAGSERLSPHAQGRAFDVNPKLNPYMRAINGKLVTKPAGAIYRPGDRGTLTGDHKLVKFLESRGWFWGGRWTLEADGKTDYHHFHIRS